MQENEPQTGLYDVYLLLRDAKQETLDRVMARYSDAAEGGISMNWDYLRTQGNFRYDNYSSWATAIPAAGGCGRTTASSRRMRRLRTPA